MRIREKITVSAAAVLLPLVLAVVIPSAAKGAPAWQQAPVLPALAGQVKQKVRVTVRSGKRQGNRAGVFAKIGDSNTEFAPNLYGFACGRPAGLTPNLARTRTRYNRVVVRNPRALPGCGRFTSFARRSFAAQAGAYSSWATTVVSELPDSGYHRKPALCPLASTPLTCEVGAIRPRFAFLLLGTNDLEIDLFFGITPGSQIESRLRPAIRSLLGRGVLPVLSTIPPVLRTSPGDAANLAAGVARTNAGIHKLARQWQLPMINLWRALRQPAMLNRGLAGDGLHLRLPGSGGRSVALRPEPTTFSDAVNFGNRALRFGANRRNLIWLRTLTRLDRVTGGL